MKFKQHRRLRIILRRHKFCAFLCFEVWLATLNLYNENRSVLRMSAWRTAVISVRLVIIQTLRQKRDWSVFPWVMRILLLQFPTAVWRISAVILCRLRHRFRTEKSHSAMTTEANKSPASASLQPMAAHKGYGFAVLVELFSAVIPGTGMLRSSF